MGSANYKDLQVWRKSMDLVVEIYKLVKLLPKEEIYALSDQMRRAAISIPSNIAEGQSRNSTKEFTQFLSVSKASAAELTTQLLICNRIGYFNDSQTAYALDLTAEVERMLVALMRSIQCNTPPISSKIKTIQ